MEQQNYQALNEACIAAFRAALMQTDHSTYTVEKYVRDVRAFARWTSGQMVDHSRTMAYRQSLLEAGYSPCSINSTLSSLNSLFKYLGWEDCRARYLRQQRRVYSPAERELTLQEYHRLILTAEKDNKPRLVLLMQTLGATGIRVGELSFITVEAAMKGEADVRCKGKNRPVFLIPPLRRRLLAYAHEQHILSGPVFITRNGRPLDRSNIWQEMKNLCVQADVDPRKVFPHNLRHLFARTFYSMNGDLSKLADILGHSSLETTRLYLISSGEEHRRQLEILHLL